MNPNKSHVIQRLRTKNKNLRDHVAKLETIIRYLEHQLGLDKRILIELNRSFVAPVIGEPKFTEGNSIEKPEPLTFKSVKEAIDRFGETNGSKPMLEIGGTKYFPMPEFKVTSNYRPYSDYSFKPKLSDLPIHQRLKCPKCHCEMQLFPLGESAKVNCPNCDLLIDTTPGALNFFEEGPVVGTDLGKHIDLCYICKDCGLECYNLAVAQDTDSSCPGCHGTNFRASFVHNKG